MIEPAYVRTMARYNGWENKQLSGILDGMSAKELLLERGAFFSSILATLNHLLWGDMLWLNRFDPSAAAPECDGKEALTLYTTAEVWGVQRALTDNQMSVWARGLTDADLQGDLSWYSGMMKRDFSKPKALCIMQFFNHQTHHRGQVHAMLTAAGHDAPVSDLIFMPEDA